MAKSRDIFFIALYSQKYIDSIEVAIWIIVVAHQYQQPCPKIINVADMPHHFILMSC